MSKKKVRAEVTFALVASARGTSRHPGVAFPKGVDEELLRESIAEALKRKPELAADKILPHRYEPVSPEFVYSTRWAKFRAWVSTKVWNIRHRMSLWLYPTPRDGEMYEED